MQSPPGPRPAVVWIAAIAAFVVAVLLVACAGLLFVVVVPDLVHPIEAGGFVNGLFAALGLLALTLALGFAAAARRLLRGDPRGLRQVALGTGMACVIGIVFIVVDDLKRGHAVEVATVAGPLGLAVVLFGLAWLPTLGTGRAWFDAHRPPAP